MTEAITLEPMHEEDLSFVMDSWLRSYDPKDYPNAVEAARYFRNQRSTADNCIDNGTVLVASYFLGRRNIGGWCCFEPGRLHYVYVKNILRGQGVATRLVEAAVGDLAEVAYTHDTPSWRGLMRDLQRRQARNWTNASARTVGGRERVAAGDESARGGADGRSPAVPLGALHNSPRDGK